jgi:hypothetical protein
MGRATLVTNVAACAPKPGSTGRGKREMSGAGARATSVAVLALLAVGIAWATPPDRIRLNYSDSTGMLTIAVHHPTFYPAAHHIAKVAVLLNDSVVLVRQFSRQTNNQQLDMGCPVPSARPGDHLSVTAICSIFGKRTETITLPASSP